MKRLNFSKSKEISKELEELLSKLTDIKIDKTIKKTQEDIGKKLEELNLNVKYDHCLNGTKIHLMVYGLSKPIGIEIGRKNIRNPSYQRLLRLGDSVYKVFIIGNSKEIAVKKDIDALLNLEIDSIQGIYKITNLNTGKVYIGSSVDIKQRTSHHKRKLNDNSHINSRLQRDWNIFGEINFTFEVVEEVEEKIDLPIREKYYIEHYSSKGTVYNWSDPMEESIKGRFKKSKIPKIKKTRNKDSKNEIVLSKIKEKFEDKMKILHEHIEERKFYPKSSLDKWFSENMDDKEISNNPNLPAILNRWYIDSGFAILNTRLWGSTFKRMYDKAIDKHEFIVVLPTTQKLLFNAKYNKK
jgi:group I intron endonuclease